MLPKDIEDNALLGRGVFSQSRAKDAKRGKVRYDIFKEKTPSDPISVDRLRICSDQILIDIQSQLGKLRKQPFQGWVIIKAIEARRNGREVRSSPQLQPVKNPYHASIFLPKNINQQKQKEHAKELAENSKWYELS